MEQVDDKDQLMEKGTLVIDSPNTSIKDENCVADLLGNLSLKDENVPGKMTTAQVNMLIKGIDHIRIGPSQVNS